MTSRADGDDSLLGTIAWWERRRLSYNIFLIVVGIPGLLLYFVAIGASHALAPGDDFVEPIVLFAAPIGANLAYTAGWLVEGALLASEPVRPAGPRLMRAGLVFSLIVVFAPALLWAVQDLVGQASGIFRSGVG